MQTTPMLSGCRLPVRRRIALGGVMLTSLLTISALQAPAANAVAPAPSVVSTKTDLTNAFQTGATSIVLDADLDDPTGYASTSDDVQTVTATGPTVLDLHGHRLDLDRLVLADNAQLQITDSTLGTGYHDSGDPQMQVMAYRTTGGTAIQLGDGSRLEISRASVTASGGDRGAGIGSAADDHTGGGELTVDQSATVQADGRDGGAGIGGGDGAAGIDVTATGADVSASGGDGGAGIGSGRNGSSAGSLQTVTPANSVHYGTTSVSAYGGSGAAGIGGGRNADGAQVDLESDGSTWVADGGTPAGSTDAPSAVGAGAGGSDPGSLLIGEDADLSIAQDSVLRIPQNETVVNHGSVYLQGTVAGDGEIDNTHGQISAGIRYDNDGDPIPDLTSRIADSVSVLGRNYQVTLNPNSGSTTQPSTRVWSTSFNTYPIATPTAADPGLVFFSWNTAADGSGSDADDVSLDDLAGTSTDGRPRAVTFYAQYGHPAAFTASALPGASLNQSYNALLPVTGDGLSWYSVDTYDDNGDPIPGLPDGLTLNPDTGRITGVATQTGIYTVHVSASGPHTSASAALTLEVAGAPAIATNALPDATAGRAYSTTLHADGRGTIRWSVAGGALPAGLALDPTTGMISGTPNTAGTTAFVVRAVSGFGSTLQPLVLTTAAAPAAPAAPAVAAPAAPVLPALGRTVLKFGHRLDLALTASSTLPVGYAVTAGALPKGLVLDPRSGVISGTAQQVGDFAATVTATSTAGSASAVVDIEIPPVQQLVGASPTSPVKAGAGRIGVTVRHLLKGERWTVRVDGDVVAHGKAKRAGSVKTTIALQGTTKDRTHTVVVAGSRAISDPAQTASTEFTVTSLASAKKLKLGAAAGPHGRQIVVSRLAPGEPVTVRVGHKTVAKGHADADGDFAFAASKTGKGSHKVIVHGATQKRTGSLTVSNPKH